MHRGLTEDSQRTHRGFAEGSQRTHTEDSPRFCRGLALRGCARHGFYYIMRFFLHDMHHARVLRGSIIKPMPYTRVSWRTLIKPTSNTRNERSGGQVWIHFALKPTSTPRPELCKGPARRSRTSHCRGRPRRNTLPSHALAASPRPLARTPRTKRKRRRNEADLPVQGCPQASP